MVCAEQARKIVLATIAACSGLERTMHKDFLGVELGVGGWSWGVGVGGLELELGGWSWGLGGRVGDWGVKLELGIGGGGGGGGWGVGVGDWGVRVGGLESWLELGSWGGWSRRFGGWSWGLMGSTFDASLMD